VIADDVIQNAAEERADTIRKCGVDLISSAVPKIVASGNEPGMLLKPIVNVILELSGSDCPKVLYVGTASFDRTDKFMRYSQAFRDLGCDIRRLDVSEKDTTPSLDEMRECVVDWAEVIMCSGGNTLHALIRWKKAGLDVLLKEAALKGTVLCGGSAGAGCWFSSLHTDSLRPDNRKNKEHVLNDLSEEELADWDYARISGLGFLDAMCVPHYDAMGSNGIGRAKHAKMMLQDDPSTPAIGIENNAALVVVGNEALAVSGDGKAKCHVVAACEITGEMKSDPLSSEEPVPISELLGEE